MLKNMKAKALALLTALAMTLGLGAIAATPALAVAAGTGSLTVTGNDAFASVDAYQMFVVEGSQADSAKYTLNSAWNGFFTKDNLKGFPETVAEGGLSDAAFTYIKGLGKNDTEKVNAFAKTAAAWAAEHLSESSAPTKVSENADDGTNQAMLSNLAFGYYLVVPNPKGSTPDNAHQGRGTDAMLVNVSKAGQTMDLKTVYPTVEKKVNNENHASASVGDTLTFTLTSTVPDTSEYTKSYQFAFEDVLSKGLTFNSITKITIGGDENTLTPDTEYKLTQTPDSSSGGTKLRIDFGTESGGIYNAKTLFDGKAGKTITVTYTATLNENAVVADGTNDATDADNTNTAKVIYSNNPSKDTTGESGESKTHQYTFGFDLNKTDGTNGLAGAKFQLKNSDGTVINLISTGKDNTYRPAKTDETGITEGIVTTPADGVIHFTGLDEGNYTLHETEAPDGYNKAADTTVTIEATYNNENGTLESWSVKVGDQDQADQTVEVVNHAGTILPGTGGIGTVVFTVAGIVLIVAGVAWAMRRRQRD
ncbi:SpaH/EbpB family LPXTG-anchored major pilin [Bifidobacterium pullorum subsp. saeculare]|uniref:SpaH/EbpB family LPXTG-anchored major pilin n=1 Tax=Bifidobacterium pullorum TaxID=78448 RepID=UPI00195D4537|nr:SpaH/EbpB family LPXTG-anchored major pilin [Bifidobacterium pullorum]MBM6705684.1 SpaH/EbpB family LPXTG-anchored major pilin [Bifidobacterium pullorum subsp. saeculare]